MFPQAADNVSSPENCEQTAALPLSRFLNRRQLVERDMKSRNKTFLAGLLILLLCAGGIWYWRKNADDRSGINYLTETVRRGEILATVNASGELDAMVSVDVGAQVSGQIEKLYVELGRQIKKGDLIAEIDSTTQRNELEKSKAQLASYEAQLAARKVTRDVAQARYNREVKLRSTDSTSRENLESAQQTLASAKADVAEMESQIVQARLAVSTAETNLGYTRISAPLDGTVVSIPVEEGQTVNANQTTPTIVKIADLSRMENKIEISEGDITRVAPGMPVIYTILSEPDISFRARLDSIDPGNTSVTNAGATSSGSSSSSSSNEAVYYYGKSIVSNEDGRLRIGMTTQNTIVVSRAQDVLIVPSIVLEKRTARGRTSYFVQVLTPAGTVEERAVETGVSDNLNTQIVSGLAEGERVVSSMMSQAEEAAASVAKMRGPRMR